MRVAIVGTKAFDINIEQYLPDGISLIVSGGVLGAEIMAEKYADKNGIPKLILLPDYQKYGKRALVVCNRQIVENADSVIVFWDGKSRGTKFISCYARMLGKHVTVYTVGNDSQIRQSLI